MTSNNNLLRSMVLTTCQRSLVLIGGQMVLSFLVVVKCFVQIKERNHNVITGYERGFLGSLDCSDNNGIVLSYILLFSGF